MVDSVREFLSNSTEFYFYLAVISTVFFIIQFCFAMLGADHGDGGFDHDMDFDHDFDHELDHDFDGSTDASEIHGTDYSGISAINLFSVKSITAFLMFFGWAGFFWGDQGYVGLAIALVCGLVMMFLTSLVIFLLYKMQHSGNISASAPLGRVASVYLKIPGGRAETGKITVKLDDCSREFRAIADEDIPHGSQVLVKKHIQGNCYLVEKYFPSETENSGTETEA